MFHKTFSQKAFMGLVIGAFVATGAAHATTPKDKFHEAYYLETAEGDAAGAAELYEEVLADRGIDPQLRARAEARLALCREDVASSDLAKLMPPDAFAYVEIRHPGDQVIKLIEQLGLLADEETMAAGLKQRIAISPALVTPILGLRGVAVGINGFDPQKGEPRGVLVLHPGDVEVIRGLIETGLPIGGQPVDPIAGYATYFIEEEVYVTLTRRLVIASGERDQISGVISRLRGEETRSLATSGTMAELAAGRGDSLLYFLVDAEPIMPMLKGLMAAEAADNLKAGEAADIRELAMVNALLDLESLRSLVGRIGVSDDGLFADIELRLKEGHHNLVYNFLRMPPINRDALESIPHGAGAFIVGSLNEVSSRCTPSSPAEPDSPVVVTGMDIGREFFANIASVAVYALPPEGPGAEHAPPMPDIAAAITVNDPLKSQALWTQILGIASMAAGAPSIEGETTDLAGVSVRSYDFPEGVTLYFATVDRDVLVASTPSAMTRSIHTQRGEKSIRDDAAFATTVSRIGPESTKALFVHPARCVDIARPFMSKHDRKEIEPFLGVLTDTVASLVIDHSGERLRISTEVTGIPQVGDLVTRMIMAERCREKRQIGMKQAIRHQNWDKALELIDAALAEQPGSRDLLRRKFEILATGRKDHAAALACAEGLFAKARDNATALNNFAWSLLTEDKYEGKYNELALKFSERSNELTKHASWAFLDTLALAKFVNGDAKSAVALEEKAITLAGERGSDDLQKALARFKAGVQ